ncbi:MAG TPA: hypothetical protein VGM82_23595 [Gemmatimonadaceae bacterium]|jgi:hypothetical protein
MRTTIRGAIARHPEERSDEETLCCRGETLRPFGRSIAVVVAAAALSITLSFSSASAQTLLEPAHTTDFWVTGSGGFGSARDHAAFAAQLALSTAIDQTMFTLRTAGSTTFGEGIDRSHYDFAFLVGKRVNNPQFPGPGNFGGSAASISVGPAWLGFDQSSYVGSPRMTGGGPALAFNADVMSHLRIVGLGVSVFGAGGVTERYIGVGLTLGLGKIH